MAKKASQKLGEYSEKALKILEKCDLGFIETEIPRIIKTRTRLGKGVDDAGQLFKLKALSKPYKEKRVRMKEKGELSDQTTPNKANNTASGQLLDSIQSSRQKNKFVFTFKQSRERTNFGGGDATNGQVSKYLDAMGRGFFRLSDSEKFGLHKKIRSLLRDAAKKLLKG